MITAQATAIKPAISIFDRSILADRALTLLVEAGAQSITLALADRKQMKLFAFETFPSPEARLDNLDSAILKHDFQSASVQVVNRKYTLVPSALYDAGDEETYFMLNHQQSGLNLSSDTVNGYHLVNVFGYQNDLTGKHFPAAQVHHAVSSMLSAIRLQSREKSIHLNFSEELLDIIIVDGKKLLYCNSFEYRSNEDALYYVLFACEQLNLDVRDVQTILSGSVKKESPLHEMLSKHLRQMNFAASPVQFAYGFENIAPHFYYSAFSHLLCVS
jgi:hypothetical protein